eukprot:gene4224-8481_t
MAQHHSCTGWKVFLSSQPIDSHRIAISLKTALEMKGVGFFTRHDEYTHENYLAKAINAITTCDLAIVLGTDNYTTEVENMLHPTEELRFIRDEERQILFVNLCKSHVCPVLRNLSSEPRVTNLSLPSFNHDTTKVITDKVMNMLHYQVRPTAPLLAPSISSSKLEKQKQHSEQTKQQQQLRKQQPSAPRQQLLRRKRDEKVSNSSIVVPSQMRENSTLSCNSDPQIMRIEACLQALSAEVSSIDAMHILEKLVLLTSKNQILRSCVKRQGIVPIISTMKANPNFQRIQKNGCICLCQLAAEKDSHSKLLASGSPQVVTAAMKRFPSYRKLQHASCIFFINLVRVNPDLAGPICRNKATLESITAMMKIWKADEDIAEVTVTALMTLSITADSVGAVVNAKCISNLEYIASAHMHSSQIKSKLLRLLRNMCLTNQGCTCILQSNSLQHLYLAISQPNYLGYSFLQTCNIINRIFDFHLSISQKHLDNFLPLLFSRVKMLTLTSTEKKELVQTCLAIARHSQEMFSIVTLSAILGQIEVMTNTDDNISFIFDLLNLLQRNLDFTDGSTTMRLISLCVLTLLTGMTDTFVAETCWKIIAKATTVKIGRNAFYYNAKSDLINLFSCESLTSCSVKKFQLKTIHNISIEKKMCRNFANHSMIHYIFSTLKSLPTFFHIAVEVFDALKNMTSSEQATVQFVSQQMGELLQIFTIYNTNSNVVTAALQIFSLCFHHMQLDDIVFCVRATIFAMNIHISSIEIIQYGLEVIEKACCIGTDSMFSSLIKLKAHVIVGNILTLQTIPDNENIRANGLIRLLVRCSKTAEEVISTGAVDALLRKLPMAGSSAIELWRTIYQLHNPLKKVAREPIAKVVIATMRLQPQSITVYRQGMQLLLKLLKLRVCNNPYQWDFSCILHGMGLFIDCAEIQTDTCKVLIDTLEYLPNDLVGLLHKQAIQIINHHIDSPLVISGACKLLLKVIDTRFHEKDQLRPLVAILKRCLHEFSDTIAIVTTVCQLIQTVHETSPYILYEEMRQQDVVLITTILSKYPGQTYIVKILLYFLQESDKAGYLRPELEETVLVPVLAQHINSMPVIEVGLKLIQRIYGKQDKMNLQHELKSLVKLICDTMSTYPFCTAVQTVACQIVQKISARTESHNLLLQEGIIPLILAAMTRLTKVTQLQVAASDVLRNMTVTIEPCRVIYNFGGIDAIFSVMVVHRHNVEVQLTACAILRNLSTHLDIQQQIIDNGGIDILLTTMHSHLEESTIQLYVFYILSDLFKLKCIQKHSRVTAIEDTIKCVLYLHNSHENLLLVGSFLLSKINLS